ncbi:MAG: glycine cleavage system protein H [Betaproteobacteria bacterium HGW-Betaproteobacteria-2]|nr:MAG: glycine cleavage system protein H [Betaproteobacteria bacterium HGW-Betaproteobacteria-2]
MKIPENLSYSSEHLWVKADNKGVFLAGITDYAQDLLGDIVFVDAPKVGSRLKATETCGLIESVKTGSDLHAPLNGTVVAVNDDLQNHPEQINDNPYGSWIFKFEAENTDLSELLDATAYRQLIGNP